MKPHWLAFLVLFAATAARADAPAPDAPGTETMWFGIIAESGDRIGDAWQQTVQTTGGRDIVAFQEIDAADLNSPTTHLAWRTERKVDAAGHTVFLSSDVQTGDSSAHTEAHIDGNVANVVRETPTERRTQQVTLPEGARCDTGDDLLPGWDPAKTPKLEFDNFDLDAMSMEHVVIEPTPNAPVDAQGRIAALRRHYQNGQLVALVRLVIDRQGRIVETRQPMFDTTLTIALSDRATATAAHPAYRMLSTVMRKSPYRIGPASMHAHIRYRFAFKDGMTFPIPQTGEQRVTAEPGFATVDICDTCGPGLATDPATLADALKPTAWLQTDSPRIKAMIEPVMNKNLTDTEKMAALAVIARRVLAKVDFVGYFSALDALSRRAGDCTEAATLLAAFGRAAGIPTRVANGLAYSQVRYHGVSNAFLPHSWVLAYTDGRWRSFDAALDVFDSTHIALTVGDGDEKSMAAAGQLASLLTWQSMAEVRTQASN